MVIAAPAVCAEQPIGGNLAALRIAGDFLGNASFIQLTMARKTMDFTVTAQQEEQK